MSCSTRSVATGAFASARATACFEPLAGRRDQARLVPVLNGSHQLCRRFDKVFFLGGGFAPVELCGQLAQEPGELRSGRRIEMLDAAKPAGKLFDVAADRRVGCLAC